jgi:glycosyltransferase involved in cell wall biosynthesis
VRVLHAIHDFLPRHRAGSELYADRLCRALGTLGVSTEVLCAEYDPSRPHASVARRSHEGLPVTELVNNWRFGRFEETYGSKELGAVLAGVLDERRPDVLHVHNLLNLSFDLPALAQARGIPVVATLHDYTLVCASGGQRIHRAEEHLCTRIDPERCSRCFAQSPFAAQMGVGRVSAPPLLVGAATQVARRLRAHAPEAVAMLERALGQRAGKGVTGADLRTRLEAVSRVYESVSLFVAPSRALGEDLAALGLPREKLEVSDYGFVPMTPLPRTPRQGPLRIGFVGTLAWHKGPHVLLEALRMLPSEELRLELWGRVETFPDYVARLRELARGLSVEFRGGFDESSVARVYAGIDVLVVSSLWAENSPLVIHEAQQAGVPVVGARMGGIGELVSDGDTGLLYDAASPASLARALRRLLDEPALLPHLGRARVPVKSIAEDASAWLGRYEALLARRSLSRTGGA